MWDVLVSSLKGKPITQFNQTEYIKNNLPPHLNAGCCLALSSIWGTFGGDDSSFIKYILTATGQAKVRGFQSLLHVCPESCGGVLFSGYACEVLRILGMRPTKQQYMVSDIASTVSKFVCNDFGYYGLIISGKEGCHMVAFINSGRTIKIFDPNHGAASWDNRKYEDLEKFLSFFFPMLYKGHAENAIVFHAELDSVFTTGLTHNRRGAIRRK